MDLDYQASGEEASEARRQPNPVPPRDYDGLLIERMVIKLPALNRTVIQAEYVKMPRRKMETAEQLRNRRRRRLRIADWMYEDALRQAKAMLLNLLRRHHPVR